MSNIKNNFGYWFWRIFSGAIAVFVGILINPATWGLAFDMNNQAVFIGIRIALILIIYFVLSSFVKKPR